MYQILIVEYVLCSAVAFIQILGLLIDIGKTFLQDIRTKFTCLLHYVIQKASCCFKDPALGKIVTYGAIVIFDNIFCNSLSFFYDNVDIGSLFSFLLYYKISNLLYIGKTLENSLHSSCTYINC